MNDNITIVMDAIKEDLEYSAEETERLTKLRSILTDEEIVQYCLDAVSDLFKKHGI